ncbi:hypothetical protein C7999DRAFT_35888 [Corynascus novoguineensis]|uniref:Uncharacterized protein n=1 Tax=Corynascus novoguineensis TaxID=1126955 RepID=A0AAN7HBK2_9PEZI|nr:hypothetical protein C7999DRAFT_35888 [Corynascus novoguineensis]
MIGKDSSVVLGMTAHRSKHWTTPADSQVDATRLDSYQSALVATQRKHGRHGKQTFMMLYDYAFALRHNEMAQSALNSKSEDAIRRACELEVQCLKLAEDCRKRAEDLLAQVANPEYNLVTRAFVLSTELLAKIHVQNKNRLRLDLLENAIRRLQHGDEECKSWAAVLSQRSARSWGAFGDKKTCKEERKRTVHLRNQM